MKKLKDQIKILKELKRQRDIASLRYYTGNSQITLLKLIEAELENFSDTSSIPQDVYISLSYPEKLATNDIKELCLIFKKLVILSPISISNKE